MTLMMKKKKQVFWLMLSFMIFKEKVVGAMLAIFFLCVFSPFSKADIGNEINFDSILKQADEIRSQDLTTFSSLLSDLEKKQSQLNDLQREYFDYLKLYEHIMFGRIDETVYYAKHFIETFKDEELNFRTRLILITALSMQRKWYESMLELNNMIKVLPSIENAKIYNMGVQLVALTYNLYGRYDFTLDFLKQYDDKPNDARGKCVSLMNTVNANLHSDTWQLTPERKISTSLCDDIGEFMASGFINVYVAKKYLKDNRASKAIELLLPKLKVAEETNYNHLIVETYVTLSSAYLVESEFQKAKDFATKVTEIAEGAKGTEPMAIAYYNLYVVEKENGNIDSALRFHELFLASQEAFLDEVKSKALAIQLAKNNVVQQEHKIELLNKQNTLLKTQSRLSKTEAENSRLMSAMAASIAVLIGFFGVRSWQTQRRLKTLSEFDYLTNIYNRRHFMTLADYALKLGKRSRHVVSCITLDLDNFKQVNDQCGHAVGDWVLKRAAMCIQKCTRENDIFARLGGEEFILLLPSCDLPAAITVADKCIKALNSIDTEDTGHDFTVGASFGISTSNDSGYDLDVLMGRSDEAMYSSKESGKNRYTAYCDLVKLQMSGKATITNIANR